MGIEKGYHESVHVDGSGQILQLIIADGKVDSKEVEALEHLLENDWIIDGAEANMLFEINDKVFTDQEEGREWQRFFVHAISKFLVFDMNSPGEITSEEAAWLTKRITADKSLSYTERLLLQDIRRHATKCCPLWIIFLLCFKSCGCQCRSVVVDQLSVSISCQCRSVVPN